MQMTSENWKIAAESLMHTMSWRKIAKHLGVPKSTVSDYLRKIKNEQSWDDLPVKPKVLFLDIETAPMRSAVWGMFKQNVGLNQIEKDWYILSFAAKWQGCDDVIYKDLQGCVDKEDDSDLLLNIWHLLENADVVVGHNLDKFDIKKINARLLLNGFPPNSPYKTVDTLKIAKRKFAFTSNKLQYLTDKLCKKFKKSEHGKFHGYHLWDECLKDNPQAWLEMRHYNTLDVLSLEELYDILKAWDHKHPNMNMYIENDGKVRCNTCLSDDIDKMDGHTSTSISKFELYKCNSCGSIHRGRTNVRSKEEMANTLVKV